MYMQEKLLIGRLRFVSNSLKGTSVEKQVSYMIYGYKFEKGFFNVSN